MRLTMSRCYDSHCMKVTLATGLYPPEIGGPATYAAMLEADLPAKGIEVSVLPFGLVRHYPKGIRHFVYAWKLWQMSKGSDAIYALDPISVGLPALLIAKLRRLPLLVRLGGDYAWEQGRIRFGIKDTLDDFLLNKKTWPLPVKVFAALQSYVVSRANRAIVPSKYLKTVVEQWGVPSENITVIYSALFPLEVKGTRDELRHKLSFTHPTIVSAGRLVPWKGFKVLIDVVAKLRQHYPHITLIIVGDGEELKKLENHTADLKLSEHVRFVGRLSKDALGATIKAADVFVLNTAYEGLSHQLIEVMDIGTPIVTTYAGGNTELITDGVNGFLVPFNNHASLTEAITRVLNHPESRERIVQSARLRSREFSKEKVIKEISAVLKGFYVSKKD